MALQKTDIQRFEWLKIQVERLGIRFPVAEIAEKTGFDQGNISSYLKGKKPISDNFITSFRMAYGVEGPSADQGEPTTKEILKVLAEAFKAQTEIMKNIESKMATQEAQAKILKDLNEALAGIETISMDTEKLLKRVPEVKAQKTVPSKGVGNV